MLIEVIMAGFIAAVASKLGLTKRYSFDRLKLKVGEVSRRSNQMSISREAGKSCPGNKT